MAFICAPGSSAKARQWSIFILFSILASPRVSIPISIIWWASWLLATFCLEAYTWIVSWKWRKWSCLRNAITYGRLRRTNDSSKCNFLRLLDGSGILIIFWEKLRTLLADDPEFYVPKVIDELTTKQVLTTELIHGLPVDKCVDLDQETRDWVSGTLLITF